MLIIEADDLPPGFCGESQWGAIVDGLNFKSGKKRAGFNSVPMGLTGYLGGRKAANLRYYHKRMQDPEFRAKEKARLKNRSKQPRKWTAEQREKHRTYMREYMARRMQDPEFRAKEKARLQRRYTNPKSLLPSAP